MPVMNKTQYRIVRSVMACGAPAAKFAKMIKVDVAEVIKVQSSSSYEQYATDDRPYEDVMQQFGDLFGFGKGFGK